MMSRVIQDGGLHVCIFEKDFTKLESYFKIEILVKSCFPHELSINRSKKGCHFGVNFLLKTRAYLTELKRATANRIKAHEIRTASIKCWFLTRKQNRKKQNQPTCDDIRHRTREALAGDESSPSDFPRFHLNARV